MYADVLKDTFGQNFVLENMPGGSGSVGCMAVARAAPDGHTLLLASNSHIVLAPLVLTGSPVNVKRDFAPIALLFTFPFLLVVNAELGPKTLKELVDYAKARPGETELGLARRRHRRAPGDKNCCSSAPASSATTYPIPAPRSNCLPPRPARCSSPSTRRAIPRACATPAR